VAVAKISDVEQRAPLEAPRAPAGGVGAELSLHQRAALHARSAAERVALALRLGRRDLIMYSKAQQLSAAEARKRLARVRRHGRTPSKCIEALDEADA
jgi:hypothetical protein